jgi:hypothetical protein
LGDCVAIWGCYEKFPTIPLSLNEMGESGWYDVAVEVMFLVTIGAGRIDRNFDDYIERFILLGALKAPFLPFSWPGNAGWRHSEVVGQPLAGVMVAVG